MRSKNPDPSRGEAGARIGICEASVASIHKLAMSPRVFIRTHKKYFVMRAAPEFHLALGIHVKNALKIVVCSLPVLPLKNSKLDRLAEGVFYPATMTPSDLWPNCECSLRSLHKFQS